jgi:uncharacterized protein YllA (UPF0747 family)
MLQRQQREAAKGSSAMDPLRYAELPGIPKIWLDFAAGSLSGLPSLSAFPNIQSLQAQAQKAISRKHRCENLSHLLALTTGPDSAPAGESIHGLEQSDAVVVVTEIQASLFGGPLFHLLKCLTAIKVCRELAKRGIPAMPVCWIGCASPGDLSAWSVSLLDNEGELHRLRLQHGEENLSSADPLPGKQIAELLRKTEGFGQGMFDAEIIEILRSAYGPGATLASATARLLSALMKERGMIVLDPQASRFKPVLDKYRAVLRNQGPRAASAHQERSPALTGASGFEQSSESCAPAFLEQNLVLPVAANVIGPGELRAFLDALPVFDELDLPRPVPWPQPGATILDRRSSRTLEKYSLGIQELFSGEREVIERIRRATPRSVSVKLKDLALEADRRMEELGSVLPAGDDILMTRNSCKERMIYQIEKVRERFEAACARREEASQRRIHRACNLLAPDGRIQESGLSGLQFLLRHSRSVLQLLYERLDVLRFEHQLISMD